MDRQRRSKGSQGVIAQFYDTNKHVTLSKTGEHWLVEWTINGESDLALFTTMPPAFARYHSLL